MKPTPSKGLFTLFASLALVAWSFSGCASPESTGGPSSPESSVKPGINDNFLDPDLDVARYVGIFEGESREVFHYREQIVAAIGLKPGQSVADVGAGTGPFMGPFARAVGVEGKVYAVDIAPPFVERLAQRARDEGYPQVEARLCSERSVDLPDDSIDLAFICDVYHHFEYPRSTMGSVRRALHEGGQVVIVDFERIPGKSRDWVLEHVRAGEREVIDEMDQFGFSLVEKLEVEGLQETWAARFRKR